MKTLSRAQFLRNLGIVGLGTAAGYYFLKKSAGSLPPPWQRSDDHFVVFIALSGGADVSQGLDPQVRVNPGDRGFFVGYREDEIIKKGNVSLGPAAASLAPFYRDICIINGVSGVRDFGHTGNLKYLLNGNLHGTQTLPRELISAVGDEAEILTLAEAAVLSDLHHKLPIDTLMERLITVSDDSLLLSLAENLEPNLSAPIKHLHSKTADLQRFYGRFKRGEDPVDAVYAAVAASFVSGHARGAVLDACRIGQIRLDHHANFEQFHLGEQKRAWENVARLFTAFQAVPYMQSHLFDFCTFVVFSEFSRTPQLNSIGGKEHNPFTNSVLLAGKNIIGNQVIGSSQFYDEKVAVGGSPLHVALPIDYSTGKVSRADHADADLIYAENIAASLRVAFNVSPADAAASKFPAIPNLVRPFT